MNLTANEKRRGHCPKCGPDRWSTVKSQHDENWEDPNGASGGAIYRMLQCQGCDSIYFTKIDHCSEWEDTDFETGERSGGSISHYWPAPMLRKRPEWLNTYNWPAEFELVRLLTDVYTALDHQLNVLVAIGARTIFDQATALLGVDPALKFIEKLDILRNDGKIGGDEHRILSVVTDAGNAAAHRGWQPNADQLDVILSTIEAFLYRSFVLGNAANELKLSVPQQQRRKSRVTTPV